MERRRDQDGEETIRNGSYDRFVPSTPAHRLVFKMSDSALPDSPSPSAQPSTLTALKIGPTWQLLRLDCDHYIVPSYGNFLSAHSQRHLRSSSAFEGVSPLQGATLDDKSKKASNTFSSSRLRVCTPPCWRDIIRALEAPWTRERKSG